MMMMMMMMMMMLKLMKVVVPNVVVPFQIGVGAADLCHHPETFVAVVVVVVVFVAAAGCGNDFLQNGTVAGDDYAGEDEMDGVHQKQMACDCCRNAESFVWVTMMEEWRLQ